MKIKKKIAHILLGVFMTAVTVCGATSLLDNKTEVLAEVQEEQAILQTYIRNDLFTVPNAKIVHEGKEYEATESIVVYPDGNAYMGEEHILNQDGEYTVKYIAEVGGKRLIAEKQFTVVATYYSFEATGRDTDSLKGASCEFVDSLEMAPNNEISGLRVSIPEGAKFQLNQAIDLNELNGQPILTIYPYNNTFLLDRDGKTIEAHDIVVTLTDYYDPDNYIELEYHWIRKEQTSCFAPILYYRAGTCGSERTAFNEKTVKTEKSFEYNGKFYEKREADLGMYSFYDRSDVYGTTAGDRTQSGVNEEYTNSCGFSFYFDNATNEVRVGEVLNKTSVPSRLVANLTQKEIYGDKAFKGFSTGEVYISVHAEQYNFGNAYAGKIPAANLDISNICGITGEQLNKCEDTARDTIEPYIVIDGIEDETAMLYTQTGSEILIPKAQAYDANLKELTTAVYLNYGNDKQTSVAYSNGKFTAAKVGTYTIVYKAVDTLGNTQTKLLRVLSQKGDNNNPLPFSVEKIATVSAGVNVLLPVPALTSKNTGAFTKVYYSYNGGNYIPVEGEGFFVEHVGEYSLKYVYGDPIHSCEYEYKFNAVVSDEVTFDEFYLPYYFIKGAKYTLDDLYAYLYTEANPKSTLAEVYVSEDGQDFVKVNGAAYEVKANESVGVKYVCNGKETAVKTVPIVDVGFNGELKKGAYFQGDGFTWESDYDGTLYQSELTGDNTLQFINVVSLSDFSFEYIIPEEYANFKYLEFTLTDYYDRNNSFTVDVQRNGSGVTFKIGDATAYSNTKFEDSVALFYYRSNKIFLGGKYVGIGTEFTTDKALFSVRLVEATGANGIKIKQLGNSVIDLMSYDSMAAKIGFASNYAVSVKQGEIVNIRAPRVFDVFSPFLKEGLVLYATAPDGTNIKTIEGVTLERGCDPMGEYSFKMEQNGIYWIYFEYTDQKGNSTTISASMSMKDNEAPSIVLDGGYSAETVVNAKLNATHKIQGYTYSDNKTRVEKLSMSVMVLKPTGELFVEPENIITLDCKGEWRIIYYCIDGEGNATTEYYTVKVQ